MDAFNFGGNHDKERIQESHKRMAAERLHSSRSDTAG